MYVVFLPCFFLVAVVIGDKSFAKPIRECLTVVAQDDSLLVETVLDITELDENGGRCRMPQHV